MYSQPPQPTQISASTWGIVRPFLNATIFTACVGQCSEQAPQLVPFVFTTQRSGTKVTFPSCRRCFCSRVIGRSAPVGHTFAQAVQSKLQKPLSKDIVGIIIPLRPYSVKAGFRTFDGHAVTHSWHAVQCFKKCRVSSAPGGIRAVWRSFVPLMCVSIFVNATVVGIAATAAASPANRNFLLPSSTGRVIVCLFSFTEKSSLKG